LFTVILTVAILLSSKPSFAINVKLSKPSYNSFGVYVAIFPSNVTEPFKGWSTIE